MTSFNKTTVVPNGTIDHYELSAAVGRLPRNVKVTLDVLRSRGNISFCQGFESHGGKPRITYYLDKNAVDGYKNYIYVEAPANIRKVGKSPVKKEENIMAQPVTSKPMTTRNDLMNSKPPQESTMSHSDIAEIAGKRPDSVKRTMEALRDRGLINVTQFVEDTGYKNQKRTAYHVNQRDSYIVMAQVSPEFTVKLVDRWLELETSRVEQERPVSFNIPTTLSGALRLAAEKEEELEVARPKAEYHDEILSATSAYNVTAIAKELGMTAVQLNAALESRDIQFKTKRSGNPWVLKAKYQNKGYTKTETFKASYRTSSMRTLWTEEGRKFIHQLFNKKLKAA